MRWIALGLALFLLAWGCSAEKASDGDLATPASPEASPAQDGAVPTGASSPATEALPIGGSVVVDSAEDGDARDDHITLREAILLATGALAAADLTAGEADNLTGEVGGELADTITFDGGAFPAEGGQPIALASPLPALSAGYDAIDGAGGAPVISGGSLSCLPIASMGNAVRGLTIRDCDTGVALGPQARENVIGGAEEGQGNVISGNRVGIEIRGSANRVEGNLIGVDGSGNAPLPNRAEGIWIAPGAQGNVIGGSEPGAGNVISGNDLFGVSIDGPAGIDLGPTTGNELVGNYIGTDASGEAAVPNRYGVNLQAGAQENVIGGESIEKANVIAGNDVGIIVRHPETKGNLISGNYLGLTAGGAAALPNGTDISLLPDAGENVVQGNVTEPRP